jgi:hypothetical protein
VHGTTSKWQGSFNKGERRIGKSADGRKTRQAQAVILPLEFGFSMSRMAQWSAFKRNVLPLLFFRSPDEWIQDPGNTVD